MLGRGRIVLSCLYCKIYFKTVPALEHTHLWCSPECFQRDAPRRTSARFWSHVDKSGGPNACWPWTASLTTNGYGQFGISPGQTIGAHVMAYELTHGRLLPGFMVCHHCDNRPCCNPYKCLFPGTAQINLEDASHKGRLNVPHPTTRGVNHTKATLTEKNVLRIRELAETYSIQQIAEMFQSNHGKIWFIVKNKTWRHLL